MLTLASLGRAGLGARLADEGIVLQTGPFHIHLTSSVDTVADGLARLYGHYPLHGVDRFADFHVRVVRPVGLRRWYRPQVALLYDGHAVFQPLPLSQAYPMVEWGLNWCVANSAHSYLIIHAAVLERGGRALILPAPPGSGKSTLCAALAHRGWRLLSDELALLRPQDGMLVPVPRPISLKNASIALMRNYLGDPVFSPEVRDTTKGTVAHLRAPDDAVARAGEVARPAWVVFPRYQAEAASTLTALSPAAAHMEVATNAFNYSLLGARGFDALADMMSNVQSFRYSYSALDDAVAEFERLADQA